MCTIVQNLLSLVFIDSNTDVYGAKDRDDIGTFRHITPVTITVSFCRQEEKLNALRYIKKEIKKSYSFIKTKMKYVGPSPHVPILGSSDSTANKDMVS